MGLKFLELDSFREISPPTDLDDADAMRGTVIVLNGEEWHVVGSAPNPNRPGDRLVFVERVVPTAND
jgi:hypothetical protein